MADLLRYPEKALNNRFDLIIIGGGIQGAMLSLEATMIGLKPLLIEKNDFGGETSFNSLRLIHGGFRYLQSMDYSRLMSSAAERRWFLLNFPDLVQPLPCLVPLYGKGLRRTSTLRIALHLYNLLTLNRNNGLSNNRQIPKGKVISATETATAFPMVNTNGLQGGAIWYDGFIENTQRLIIEVLRMAANKGAVALNYMEAKQLRKESNQMMGITAFDSETNKEYQFDSKIVINATGPWCRELAQRFDRDQESLFRSMIAWNILFDRDQISNYGVAVTPERKNNHTYFIVPWKNRFLAGTGHASWLKSSKKPMPSNGQIINFIDDLNHAIPNLKLKRSEILHIFPGLQSATRTGGHDLSSKEIIYDHAKQGGPTGLYSVSGVKLTTSRLMAEKTLRNIFAKKLFEIDNRDEMYKNIRDEIPEKWNFPYQWRQDSNEWKKNLEIIINTEAVMHLDDLFFHRTTLWENPQRTIEIAPLISDLFDWSETKRKSEITKLISLIKERNSF